MHQRLHAERIVSRKQCREAAAVGSAAGSAGGGGSPSHACNSIEDCSPRERALDARSAQSVYTFLRSTASLWVSAPPSPCGAGASAADPAAAQRAECGARLCVLANTRFFLQSSTPASPPDPRDGGPALSARRRRRCGSMRAGGCRASGVRSEQVRCFFCVCVCVRAARRLAAVMGDQGQWLCVAGC